MKINMLRYYKSTIIVFGVLSFIIIIASVIFAFLFWSGSSDDIIMLLLGIFAGIMCFLFPIMLNGRQLTHVSLSADGAVSYSFFGKKLCDVNSGENTFYAFFDVRFSYASPIKFIAVSNESFDCKKDIKRFYGTYDRRKIIIFPYDDQTAHFFDTRNWHKTV